MSGAPAHAARRSGDADRCLGAITLKRGNQFIIATAVSFRNAMMQLWLRQSVIGRRTFIDPMNHFTIEECCSAERHDGPP